MNISAPHHTTYEQRQAYKDRVAQAAATQAAFWAVAPDHTITVSRGELKPGDEVLLTDLPEGPGKLSSRDQMAALVGQGVVLRASESAHRRNDLAAAEASAERFIVGASTLSTLYGLIESGQRIVASDVIDGLSGLLDLERRGLVTRITSE